MAHQSPGHGRSGSIGSNAIDVNATSRASVPVTRPERPSLPFEQFTQHMTPQLEADNYPGEHIPDRILSEWDGLSTENRKLWEDRYHDQMRDYEGQMDAFKKANRRGASGASFTPVNS
jgi:hypothetical protein